MQLSTEALLSNALNANSSTLTDLRGFFSTQSIVKLDAIGFFVQDSGFIAVIEQYLTKIRETLEQLDDNAIEEQVVALNYIIYHRKDYTSDHFVLKTPKNCREKIDLSFQIQAHIMLVDLFECFEEQRALTAAQFMIDIDPEYKEHPLTINTCNNHSLQRLRNLQATVAKDKQHNVLSRKTSSILYPLCVQLIKDRIMDYIETDSSHTPVATQDTVDFTRIREQYIKYELPWILEIFELLQKNWCEDEVLLKTIKAHAAILRYLIDVYIRKLFQPSLLRDKLEKSIASGNRQSMIDAITDTISLQKKSLLKHCDSLLNHALLKHPKLVRFVLLDQHLTLEQKTVLMDPAMLNIFSRYPIVLLVAVNTKQIDHLLKKIPHKKNRKTMKAYHEFLKIEETALLSDHRDSESLDKYAQSMLNQYAEKDVTKDTISQFFMPNQVPSLVTLSAQTFFNSITMDSDISQCKTEANLTR